MAERTRSWWPLVTVFVVSALILWHFMDRYWYPTDDGLYAHVAERLLAGEVLHRDIQDIHPGYIHFLHALAFRVFGLDLLSLRYPLVAAAAVQAVLVYLLLRRRSAPLAVVGSIAAIALGLVQFMSPTANWYVLPLCVGTILWLVSRPSSDPSRLYVAGVLLGVLTLFRHLSGVWVWMGVLVVVVLEESRDRPRDRSALARFVIAIMLIAMVVYVVTNRESEPGGILLIAVWPAAVLVWMLTRVRAGNRETAQLLLRLGAGAALPVLPLVAYHLLHESTAMWIRDTVFAGARETGLGFFGNGWYGILPLAGMTQVFGSWDAIQMVNGAYWTLLPLLWAINGVLVLKAIQREDVSQLAPSVVATFYAMVSLYLEGPLYMYYSIGLTLVSLLWMASTGTRARRVVWAATAAWLGVVALIFHAGQTRHRTPREILQGDRIPLMAATDAGTLPRNSLRIDRTDNEIYRDLVTWIQAETPADGAMLALPNNAELYFLAARRNPSRFYNAALGVQTESDFDTLLASLAKDPPSVVTFDATDKYNTPLILRVMDDVRSRYEYVGVRAGLELYRRRLTSPPADSKDQGRH